ncbi:MAG: PA2169 family four-helix-bundle protein, partial [Sphingomonas sp.]
MTEISHEIRTLNGLIAHLIDSIDAYVAAAEEPRAGRLGEMFRARADERRSVVRNFQSEVARLGGEPEEYGTLLARAHRTDLKLKAAVAGNDARAIISEVERGEDHLKARFESALADESL